MYQASCLGDKWLRVGMTEKVFYTEPIIFVIHMYLYNVKCAAMFFNQSSLDKLVKLFCWTERATKPEKMYHVSYLLPGWKSNIIFTTAKHKQQHLHCIIEALNWNHSCNRLNYTASYVKILNFLPFFSHFFFSRI